jgi:hypothetical protein
MTTLLPYVIRIPGPKRDYYYFRYGAADRASDDRKRIRLPGRRVRANFCRPMTRWSPPTSLRPSPGRAWPGSRSARSAGRSRIPGQVAAMARRGGQHQRDL